MLGSELPRLVEREGTLTKIFDELQFESTIVKEKELRASSFPVCGLLFLDSFLNPRETSDNRYHSEWHTRIGHVIHEYLQEKMASRASELAKGNLGQTALLYGNWDCQDCEMIDLRIARHGLPCPSCGSLNRTYRELAFENEKPSAHIDGLLVEGHHKHLPDILETNAENWSDIASRLRFVLLDYKTANKEGLSSLPVAKHLLQLAVYAVKVETHLNLQVDSLSVLYARKDKPTDRKEFSIKVTDELMEKAEWMVEWATLAFNVFVELKALAQLSVDEKEEKRPYIRKKLLELYHYRLCNNETWPFAEYATQSEFYEAEVKPFFFEADNPTNSKKQRFRKSCLLDCACPNKKAFLTECEAELLYGQRQPIAKTKNPVFQLVERLENRKR